MADSRTYIKPSDKARKLNNFLARVGAPAVAIPGRRSGVMRVAAVIPVTVEGKKYVVSTRGDSDWVRRRARSVSGSWPFTAGGSAVR